MLGCRPPPRTAVRTWHRWQRTAGGGRQGGRREAGGVPGIGGSESIPGIPLPYIYTAYTAPGKSQKKSKKAKKVLYKASKM